MNWVDILVPEAQPGSTARYEPLEWAKANCPTYITNDAVLRDGGYHCRFYFGNNWQGEQDRIMFAMKWS